MIPFAGSLSYSYCDVKQLATASRQQQQRQQQQPREVVAPAESINTASPVSPLSHKQQQTVKSKPASPNNAAAANSSVGNGAVVHVNTTPRSSGNSSNFSFLQYSAAAAAASADRQRKPEPPTTTTRAAPTSALVNPFDSEYAEQAYKEARAGTSVHVTCTTISPTNNDSQQLTHSSSSMRQPTASIIASDQTEPSSATTTTTNRLQHQHESSHSSSPGRDFVADVVANSHESQPTISREPMDAKKIEEWLDLHPDFVARYCARKVPVTVTGTGDWLLTRARTTLLGRSPKPVRRHIIPPPPPPAPTPQPTTTTAHTPPVATRGSTTFEIFKNQRPYVDSDDEPQDEQSARAKTSRNKLYRNHHKAATDNRLSASSPPTVHKLPSSSSSRGHAGEPKRRPKAMASDVVARLAADGLREQQERLLQISISSLQKTTTATATALSPSPLRSPTMFVTTTPLKPAVAAPTAAPVSPGVHGARPPPSPNVRQESSDNFAMAAADAQNVSTWSLMERKMHGELQDSLVSLMQHLYSDLDLTVLCRRIMQSCASLLNADRCSLFLVDRSGERASGEPVLTSLCFDIGRTHEADDAENTPQIVPPTNTAPATPLKHQTVVSRSSAADSSSAQQQRRGSGGSATRRDSRESSVGMGSSRRSSRVDWVASKKSTTSDEQQQSTERHIEVTLPLEKDNSIAAYCASTGESVMLDDAYTCQMFNKYIDEMTGYRTKSIISMPVKHGDTGEVIAVAQVINKRDINSNNNPSCDDVVSFTEQDAQIFSSYLACCAIALKNAQIYEKSRHESSRNQILLELARTIFEEYTSFHVLMEKIIAIMYSHFDCEDCRIFLKQNESESTFNEYFDFISPISPPMTRRTMVIAPPFFSFASFSSLVSSPPSSSGTAFAFAAAASAAGGSTRGERLRQIAQDQQQQQQLLQAQVSLPAGSGRRDSLFKTTSDCSALAATNPEENERPASRVELKEIEESYSHRSRLRRRKESSADRRSAFCLQLASYVMQKAKHTVNATMSADDEFFSRWLGEQLQQQQQTPGAGASAMPDTTTSRGQTPESGNKFVVPINISAPSASTSPMKLSLSASPSKQHGVLVRSKSNDAVESQSSHSNNSLPECALAAPIPGRKPGSVLGVVLLLNKKGAVRRFNKADESFLETLSLFCGLGITNARQHEQMREARARLAVVLDTLSYHAIAPEEDVLDLRTTLIPGSEYFQLYDLAFDDIPFDYDELTKACVRMFMEPVCSGGRSLFERFHVDYEMLCRWILSVRRNYRPVKYHNWRHAFSVGQSMFACIAAAQFEHVFSDLEILSLIVAAICHDLDHRGTNNDFQLISGSPLAKLYSTSPLENHHFDECLMLISVTGGFTEHMTALEYREMIHLVRHAILATDLLFYLKRRDEFFRLAEASPLTDLDVWKYNDDNRALLRAMLMTASDLSAVSKSWPIQKRVAELVASEFFDQGDIEKRILQRTPSDMMNRDKMNEIPRLQCQFIDFICMPLYRAFSQLNPVFVPGFERCQQNKQQWAEYMTRQAQLVFSTTGPPPITTQQQRGMSNSARAADRRLSMGGAHHGSAGTSIESQASVLTSSSNVEEEDEIPRTREQQTSGKTQPATTASSSATATRASAADRVYQETHV